MHSFGATKWLKYAIYDDALSTLVYIVFFVLLNVQHITEATRLNYEQNMHDAIAVFPRLQTGLDVNVKFTGFVLTFA